MPSPYGQFYRRLFATLSWNQTAKLWPRKTSQCGPARSSITRCVVRYKTDATEVYCVQRQRATVLVLQRGGGGRGELAMLPSHAGHGLIGAVEKGVKRNTGEK